MVQDNLSLENIFDSYLKCRANKRNSRAALEFEYDAEEKLFRLWERLVDGTYHPSRSICFVINKPKLREIFASSFEDRVVHHVLVRYLEKIWEPKFVFDSYSCRVGKGVHLAVKRLQRFISQVSSNGVRRTFYLHVDIKDFFMTVDKEVLFGFISRHVNDKRMLGLARKIIFSDPTGDFIFLGRNRQALKNVPENKSLFNKNNKQGLPIGNLTSQFFANVYLDPIDQYVKHNLKCRHYVRYCDDMILLENSSEQLKEWRQSIEEYAAKILRLQLNKRATHIAPVNNGIDFLGFITRKDYILVRRRSVGNLKIRLRKFENLLTKETAFGTLFKYDIEVCDKLLHTLNSYLGHFKFADTYKLIDKIFLRHSFLNEYYVRSGKKVIRNYNFRQRYSNLAAQYWLYRRKYQGYLVFFQVGCFIEFYGRHANVAQKLFGLHVKYYHKRLRPRCGFPLKRLNEYIDVAVREKVPFVVISQTGREGVKIMQRDIAWRFVPECVTLS
jgi:retron-type reverse transcriptase